MQPSAQQHSTAISAQPGKYLVVTLGNESYGIPVLITGESGVGKERIADAVQHLSDRAARPYVKVNCAAINPIWLASSMARRSGSSTAKVATTAMICRPSEGRRPRTTVLSASRTRKENSSRKTPGVIA